VRSRWLAAVLSCIVALGAVVVPNAAAHPGPVIPIALGMGANLSTSGDYATDVLGDPWDFSNVEDVNTAPGVGCESAPTPTQFPGVNCSVTIANGQLSFAGEAGSLLWLVRSWGLELTWGRDGENVPINAGAYPILTLSNCPGVGFAVRFANDAGQEGFVPLGCSGSPSYDMRQLSAAWSGKIVSLGIYIGSAATVSFDWIRLRRPDAPALSPGGVPVARVLTPNADGGSDYASDNGNPFDMADAGDVLDLHDIAGATFANGQLSGTIVGNDSYVELPLRTPLQPDTYHRFSADLCFDGVMNFADRSGGGMEVRVVWFGAGGVWSESQSIVPSPGCNHISIDLATDPPEAVNDENTVAKVGWRGQHINRLRVDLSEDHGPRHFWLSNVRFADDAAFASTFPIQYQDAAGAGGATADIYATTNRGFFDGVQIARGAPVNGASVNTFTWNGTDVNGNPMANGTYWIYTVIRNRSGVATGYSAGPVRLQRAVPPTPSDFVPLSPARLLDTRNGIGGNIVPLMDDVTTELQVAGRGGVPGAGATAVVLNVTVDHPNSPGVLTVWPSGEPRQLVSSVNFNPGDVVANMVTVKLGANGKVSIYNLKGWVPTVVDVVGYYTAGTTGSGRFTPLTPGRVLDTGFVNKIGPGGTIDVQVNGVRGVPASGVSGVALNVTVDDPSARSYFTVYPTGEGRPNASTLNFVPGLTVANMTLAKVGAGGRVSIWNYDGTARVVADVVGYFSGSGGRFVPVAPARVVDTRIGLGLPQAQIGQDQTVTIPMVRAGSPVPGNATGAVINLTSTESSAQSFLTMFPTGTARPAEGSSVNPRVGVPVPNQDYAKLGSGGQVQLYNFAGSTDVVIDVFGYIVP